MFQQSELFLYFAFFTGLCVGSFCNVVIYRLPRGGSVFYPARSFCPACEKPLSAHFNIPLLSYILLRGKCWHCKTPISIRYPIVELATGIIFLLTCHAYGVPFFLVTAIWLTSLLVITFIDLEHQIIPDAISLPGILYGLIFSFLSMTSVTFMNSLAGALIGGGIFMLIIILSRGGMGGGDVKMIAMIGSFVGWQKMLLTIFTSALLGSIVGIFLVILGKKGRKSKIPYGPFIALGGVISLFWGEELIEYYLRYTFNP